MMPSPWLAAAEEFAEAIREHGCDAAFLTASAWRAGVDPGATRSLLAAASVLAGGGAVARAWGRLPPCPGIGDFLGGAEQIEGEVAQAARFAYRMARDCEAAMDAALEAHGKAKRAADDAAARGNGAVAAAAAEQQRMAAAAVADCDAALEVLAGAGGALQQAGQLLQRVPAEFEETYEELLRFGAAGRKLPWNGSFITPRAA